MKKLENDKINNKFKKIKFVIFLILFAVIGLSLFQIIFTNQTASGGQEVSLLEKEKEQLQEENEKIETEIAKTSSLSNIEKRAIKIGFIKASSIVYLSNPLPVALNLK